MLLLTLASARAHICVCTLTEMYTVVCGVMCCVLCARANALESVVGSAAVERRFKRRFSLLRSAVLALARLCSRYSFMHTRTRAV